MNEGSGGEPKGEQQQDNTTMFTNNNTNTPSNKPVERVSKGSTSSNGSSANSSANSSLETQAKEKLAIYVYEYLLHQGANRAAQTFLSEIQWEKNIPSVGDSPGFLHSWWSVFWDLYQSAPERQDPHNHNPEAKAFHDLNSGQLPSPSYIPQPPGDMASIGAMNPGYFQFMNNRYGQGRPMRMPTQMGPGSQYPTMDMSRQQQQAQGGPYQNANSMMNAMRNFNNGMPPVPPSYNRIPSMNNGSMMGNPTMGNPTMGNPNNPMANNPMANPAMGNTQMPPNTMQMGPRPAWNSPTTPTPLTPVPQDPNTQVSQFGMTQEPVNPMVQQPDPVKLEPRDTLDEIPSESNESAEIQRIKESMKEEVKKFESQENSEYYNMH